MLSINIQDEWNLFLSQKKKCKFQNQVETCGFEQDEMEKLFPYRQKQHLLPQVKNIDVSPEIDVKSFKISTRTRTWKGSLSTLALSSSDMFECFMKIDIMRYENFKEGFLKKEIRSDARSHDEIQALHNFLVNETNNSKILGRFHISAPSKRSDQVFLTVMIGVSSKDLIENDQEATIISTFANCIGLYIRLHRRGIDFMEVYVKVFHNGQIDLPGYYTEEEVEYIWRWLQAHLPVPLRQPQYTESSTVLTNADFTCNFQIQPRQLAQIFQDKYHYNYKEVHLLDNKPGVRMKYKAFITCTIFRTGKVLLSGACTFAQITNCFEEVRHNLLESYRDIRLDMKQTYYLPNGVRNRAYILKRKYSFNYQHYVEKCVLPSQHSPFLRRRISRLLEKNIIEKVKS